MSNPTAFTPEANATITEGLGAGIRAAAERGRADIRDTVARAKEGLHKSASQQSDDHFHAATYHRFRAAKAHIEAQGTQHGAIAFMLYRMEKALHPDANTSKDLLNALMEVVNYEGPEAEELAERLIEEVKPQPKHSSTDLHRLLTALNDTTVTDKLLDIPAQAYSNRKMGHVL